MTEPSKLQPMKRYIILLISSLLISLSASAQGGDARHNQWIKEMQQAKLEFFIKKLSITADQKAQFTRTFNEMETELATLRESVRSMSRAVKKKANPTDLDYEKAAEAQFEYAQREGVIHMKYYAKFKTFLTKKQLFEYQNAERQWMKKIMQTRKRKKK